MPRALGQIDARKHQAILDAASEVLAERGFGASIEEVARRAGVSKQTIYNHYKSKTELVRILVERRRSLVTATLDQAPPEQRVEVTLARYAAAILQAMMNPASLQLMRMAITSTTDMPELARAVYDAGIGAASRHLANYLSRRPELEIDNPRRAADVFVGMATGRLQTRLLMGVESGFEPDQVAARAEEAADRFVRAYRRTA
ncbi:TetR/AcrR family transcriptional regulator [Caulobacter sp. S45]|uniref:TetR/AcrR family transcriptional regulator n=1 Tax=Caulobacter sp. S45 TaxID=1641861 RepID=UPI00157645D3|nr:TetR/AcrR family transcriptional regulator [Caulobacter sp. S45]